MAGVWLARGRAEEDYGVQSTDYGFERQRGTGKRRVGGAGWLEYGWLGVGPKRITEFRVQIADLKGRG